MRWLAVVVSSFAGLALAPIARAETVVPGGSIGTQTWTAAQGPYRLQGDVTVPSGVTLTIDPGVTIIAEATDSTGEGSAPPGSS
jgi:hypothetical protein